LDIQLPVLRFFKQFNTIDRAVESYDDVESASLFDNFQAIFPHVELIGDDSTQLRQMQTFLLAHTAR
jgi:hypothetical protein